MSVADSRRVPKEQIAAVVVALYARADRLGWTYLPPASRTALYDEWVRDPEIGGVLVRYMSSENARSWIKDGPMKEYARAKLGAGRYAKFGATLFGPRPEQLVGHVLGATAIVIEGSIGVKPFHCLASLNSATVYVCWDSGQNLRHLVWACINYLAGNPDGECYIVILESLELPTTQIERLRHSRISKRCSIGFGYYRINPGPSGNDPVVA